MGFQLERGRSLPPCLLPLQRGGQGQWRQRQENDARAQFCVRRTHRGRHRQDQDEEDGAGIGLIVCGA